MRLDPFVYVALHFAEPTIGQVQTTMELQCGGYARQRIKKRNKRHSVQFPCCQDGDVFATHFSIGTLPNGDGLILEAGEIKPAVRCENGVTPLLTFQLDVSELLRSIKRNAKLAKGI